jgi:hypothetical protein
MTPFSASAVLANDGMIHLPVPGVAPGSTLEVTLTVLRPPESPDSIGGLELRDLIGSLDDDGFRRPDQGHAPQPVSFE